MINVKELKDIVPFAVAMVTLPDNDRNEETNLVQKESGSFVMKPVKEQREYVDCTDLNGSDDWNEVYKQARDTQVGVKVHRLYTEDQVKELLNIQLMEIKELSII